MTSTVADILTSAAAIGEGTLLSPESHALQLAPSTAKLAAVERQDVVRLRASSRSTAGWCRTRRSPAMRRRWPTCRRRKLAIVVSTTMQPEASQEGNLSTDLLKEIAAALAPDAPL